MPGRPLGTVRWIAPVLTAVTLLAACGSRATFRPVGAASPTCIGTTGGDAISPAPGVKGGTRWLFRCDHPKVAFQTTSVKLANLVANIHGLGVTGLKSTPDTAALILQEDDPTVPWGTHLFTAERTVLETFARDRGMGDWLILVTDVVVPGKDPIPLTAYRWTRQQVDTYVACGIPATGSNDCKSAFFQAADQIVLAPEGGAPHGK